MNKHLFWLAFGAGLLTIGWVGAGFAGHNAVALGMTLLIGAAYLAGAWELRQYRADTAVLGAALADEGPVNDFSAWLGSVPAPLRAAVRLRVQEARGGLPTPSLTPYLVGLLVMLGMLGTFLGMVVTFKGAVFALEGSTDLQAIRSALAEPIRGLGLSFGTSVAGVAASAMLGLMAALSRRERAEAARVLDVRAATVLRPFSLAHQREESLQAAKAQADMLPAVLGQLDGLMARIEARSQQLDERLLASQAQFHREASAAYAALGRDVGAALKDSLAAGARAAGDSIRPVLEDAVGRIAQGVDTHWAAVRQDQAHGEAQRLQAWSAQLEAMAGRLGAQWQRITDGAESQAAATRAETARWITQSEALVQARTEAEARWMQEHGARMEQLSQRWEAGLATLREDEHRRGEEAVARIGELQAAVAQQLASLGTALEAPLARLLETASEVPQAAAGVLAQLRQEMARLAQQENAALQERTVLVERLGSLAGSVEEASRNAAAMAAQAGANAVELASWGDAFSHSVETFHASSEKLVAAMQQVETAVSRATSRSDEQLAYYVAQAREVIDLSIASQHGVLERLRELSAQRAAA